MSEENRKLGIRWFEEIWNQRRTETIDELLGADGVGHMEGGDVRGPEEFKRARAVFLGALPDMKVEVQAAVADGEQVAVRWRVTGTHLGPGLGIPPTGLPVAFRGISWIRVAGGRMIEGWDAWNQNALMGHLHAAATEAAKTAAKSKAKPKPKPKPKAKKARSVAKIPAKKPPTKPGRKKPGKRK